MRSGSSPRCPAGEPPSGHHHAHRPGPLTGGPSTRARRRGGPASFISRNRDCRPVTREQSHEAGRGSTNSPRSSGQRARGRRLDAGLAGRIDGNMVSVESASCRAHQHAAGACKKEPPVPEEDRRPGITARAKGSATRGGLTCTLHLAGEGGCRPPAFPVTPGRWGDAPQMIEVLERVRVPRPQAGRPRARPEHLGGDEAYSSRRNERVLEYRDARGKAASPCARWP